MDLAHGRRRHAAVCHRQFLAHETQGACVDREGTERLRLRRCGQSLYSGRYPPGNLFALRARREEPRACFGP